jgi:hypothetical protein
VECYARRRRIPSSNACHIRASTHEHIDRAAYGRGMAAPIGGCLKKNRLAQRALYIVLTSGVPLRIEGAIGLGDYPAIPRLGWRNIVAGDALCSLGRP